MAKGTIRASSVNLRRSLTTGPVVRSLRRSTEVEVLGEQTWLRVRTRDGREGFVLADFVEEVDPQADQPVETALARQPPEEHPVALPSLRCDIAIYRHECFVGKELRADRDFFGALDRLAALAKRSGVRIHVTSSARDPHKAVSGAIVRPAKRSNHMIGHAIDMNLESDSGFFNSRALRKRALPEAPPEIREFIEAVRADAGLRWGGDFSSEDPVHIDDGLNVDHPDVWDAKFASRA